MNKAAVFHINTEEYVYQISRNCLVFKLKVAKKEIRQCHLVYWNRTDVEKKKEHKMEWYARDGCFDYFQVEITYTQIARYQKYYFRIEDTEGKLYYYTTYGVMEKIPENGFFEYLYANENEVLTVPEWSKGIIYYQIFPERFCNGNKDNDPPNCLNWGTLPTRENYMGGDLRGIINKIPYLKDLGIECLYINPIFKGDFNHKYATTDYYQIDPMFGTNEDFKELVNNCHSQGIKVILDGVFNHTGINFEPFREVLEKQEASMYKDWFFINHYPVTITHHDYECVGAYKWMPKLNSANREVREFIIRVMEYWILEYGIDGWRLDVADEVDATVWQEARLLLKEKDPKILLMGETWGYGGKLLRGNQMDSVMNYLFRDAVRDYFAKEELSATEFDIRINNMLALYREETIQGLYNLLDSHDTERFMFLCDEVIWKMKLAVAFQFLFIGSPAVYYGDEVGMTGDNDPDCRRCMVWDDKVNTEMKDWYRSFIDLRKDKKCIRKGHYRSIIADDKKDIIGFVRYLEDEEIYILIHKGDKEEFVECPVLAKAEYTEVFSGQLYESSSVGKEKVFLNGDMMEYRAYLEVDMDPYSVKVISKNYRRE